MEIIIGLIIIAIGSFCQSSSYVPIKKVKEWSWESFWLLQGVFAWLVFPLLGALLGIPQGSSLFDLWGYLATHPITGIPARQIHLVAARNFPNSILSLFL